jgi:uncharacterized protein YggE
MMRFQPLLCLAVLSPALAAAQGPSLDPQPHIDGTGEAVIERVPETLRLSVQLMAKSMQMKQCLAQLKERGEAARATLASLGAAKESIKIGAPHVDESQAAYRKQMEMMMAQQMNRRGKKKKGEVVYPTVLVAQLTADWPLAGKAPDEILMLSHELSEKIKAADLSGSKKSEKLLPEEEEAMEESEGANIQRYSQGNEKPGEPVFVYVSTVPADAQQKGLAEAFQKAKESAAQLAQAADGSLGPLRSLRRDDTATEAFDMSNFRGYGGEYGQYFSLIAGMRQGNAARAKGTEIIGPSPEKIEHHIRVVASFELRAK